MKYLVDANVLREPTRPAPEPQVVEWPHDNEAELAVNPIVLGGLEYGILLLPGGRRRRHQAWFAGGVQRLKVLDVDAVSAAAALSESHEVGQFMSVKHSLIAATAAAHHLSIATGNVADFRHCGVRPVNPFEK